jgi:CheY-like chemotaxis protein
MEHQKRILIVDDEPANVKLLSNMLISLGYDSESVFDGQAALQSLHKDIDLILSDIMMPQIDGYELCRRIRNNPDYCDVPVILVTILSDREDRIRAVQAGANDFISKPVDKLELQVRVASLLKMKQAEDRVKQHTRELQRTVEQKLPP